MKLATPLQFGPDNKIAPVCLPTPGATYVDGTMTTVTGWGTLSYGKKNPLWLKNLQIYYY